jgi:hypothetical protein
MNSKKRQLAALRSGKLIKCAVAHVTVLTGRRYSGREFLNHVTFTLESGAVLRDCVFRSGLTLSAVGSYGLVNCQIIGDLSIVLSRRTI